ncbi:MAG TPA: SOS response-associated peptidase [Candidatus Marinimicrobia bacterium]|nr:SOS response-associated peptidase [Candidatus Neomarinimicrobiota bacterium]
MCGRFTLTKDKEEIEERFEIHIDPTMFSKTYNAAPNQILPIITNDIQEQASFHRWGLIPHWAKDERIGNKLINARAETITEKPSFRDAVQKRRCLVITDGFYEWKRSGTNKQPYRITLTDESLFAYAGLWESWSAPDGREVRSFTIITVEPNELIKPIHNRMPAMLSQETEKVWISDEPLETVLHLLQPYDEEEMNAYPVSTRVNSTKNNDPSLLETDQQTLFSPINLPAADKHG